METNLDPSSSCLLWETSIPIIVNRPSKSPWHIESPWQMVALVISIWEVHRLQKLPWQRPVDLVWGRRLRSHRGGALNRALEDQYGVSREKGTVCSRQKEQHREKQELEFTLTKGTPHVAGVYWTEDWEGEVGEDAKARANWGQIKKDPEVQGLVCRQWGAKCWEGEWCDQTCDLERSLWGEKGLGGIAEKQER